MARGSLNETKNHLYSARRKGLITDSELRRALNIFYRSIGATSALGRYLRSSQAQRFIDAIRARSEPER